MKDPSDSMAMFLRAKHTVVCVHGADGDDVLYDTRLHDHCPECGSKEGIPLTVMINPLGEEAMTYTGPASDADKLQGWQRCVEAIKKAADLPIRDDVSTTLECASAPGVRFW